ncbi:MAG: nucleoside triphosphate pyrophosphohydrolase [Hyphomicrobiales bacterium]|nr:nucleoside triphosphate pyrophosphohydrolase [Hyphomicrobiales bacterium]
MTTAKSGERNIDRLLDIMAALRTPVTGCPWDLEQSFATIAPYTIEEAYEVADAIERGDLDDLKDELGDLLLQVVFHARMAEEANAFDFNDVAAAISDKMVRRHPHVFGDSRADAPEAVKAQWEAIKAEESRDRAENRMSKGLSAGDEPLLDSVPIALPALLGAFKLQRKAARVGFDWPETDAVLAKIREELGEVEAELAGLPANHDRLEDEIGDLLFSVANLARHLKIEPEAALRRTNAKFRRRFGYIEERLRASGQSLDAASLDEMEALWQAAKDAE